MTRKGAGRGCYAGTQALLATPIRGYAGRRAEPQCLHLIASALTSSAQYGHFFSNGSAEETGAASVEIGASALIVSAVISRHPAFRYFFATND